jgi:hypothetical protein
MSAYRKVETQFSSRAMLREALKAVGLPFEETRPNEPETHLIGYKGDQRQETATFAIRREYVGSASNDIGWHWDPEARRFVEIVSQFDLRRSESVEVLNQVRREYAVATTIAQARARGLSVQREDQPNGGIRLRVVGQVQASGQVAGL